MVPRLRSHAFTALMMMKMMMMGDGDDDDDYYNKRDSAAASAPAAAATAADDDDEKKDKDGDDGAHLRDLKDRVAASLRDPRVALIAVSLLNVLLFSGIIFGWAPLMVMLQAEGQYHEYCDTPASSHSCPEQMAKYALIFSVATFLVNGISLPSGMLLDQYGSRFMSGLAMAFTVLGLIFTGFSDSKTFDLFVPAYAFISVGGQMTLFSALPTAFVLPEYQTMILAVISCLFDGSCIIFQLLSTLHQTFGFSRSTLFVGYAIIAVPCYLLQLYLWKFASCVGENGDRGVAAHGGGKEGSSGDLEEDRLSMDEMVNGSRENSPSFSRPTSPSHPSRVASSSPQSSSSSSSSARPPTDAVLAASSSRLLVPATVPVSERPLVEQLQTWDFFFILLFASLGILRANLYIATNEELLDNLGDSLPSRDHLYSRLFGYFLPLGFLFIPAIDFSVGRSLRFALFVTNGLSLVVAVFMLIHSLHLQTINFLVFAGFRAFLYGVMSAFIAQTFGLRTLGRITGCVFTTGSVINLVQAPIINVVNFYLNEDTDFIAWGMIAVGVLLIPAILAVPAPAGEGSTMDGEPSSSSSSPRGAGGYGAAERGGRGGAAKRGPQDGTDGMPPRGSLSPYMRGGPAARRQQRRQEMGGAYTAVSSLDRDDGSGL